MNPLSRNTNDTRSQLEQLDRGRSNSAEQVNGYEIGTGEPRAWPGDEDAPFVKTPPFTEEPQLWLPATTLSTSAYGLTDPIDVEDFRLLQVLFELQWDGVAESDCQLSILAEHLAASVLDPPEQWYVTGVVDPTVSYVNPFGIGDGYGSRVFAPSEFRTPVFTAAALRTQRFALQFDVTNAKAFRLRYAQVVQAQAASVLALAYQRSN